MLVANLVDDFRSQLSLSSGKNSGRGVYTI